MGLIGGMIVTRADAATEDGRPNDVDLELFAMFHVRSADSILRKAIHCLGRIPLRVGSCHEFKDLKETT